MSKPVIAVVGPGRMGRGMAHAFAYTGHQVRLIDVKPRPAEAAQQALVQARGEVVRSLDVMAGLGAITPAQAAAMAARIVTLAGDAADAALAEADIVFEAVPEVMALKQAAFARVSAAARPDVPVSSTTSTFNVDALAAFVTRPERFLNTHWLNPAFLIPLVEVSPGAATDPAVTAGMLQLLRSAGKVPVECKAAPGFIVPRIQALAMNEAARIVSEGVATAEAVDTATRVAFGTRFAILGLLEFIDYGGGDILYYASNYLKDSLGEERFAPPEVIVDNMQQGRTGARAGAGFYDWASRDLTDYQRELFAKLFDLLGHLKLLPTPS
ncbi:3-hydroxybutyryl-CoA dehydrogenase [Limobrevibacterium gyesilva]|uniref:L-gulonate 3-dehydrogenase n=1 Tax=Limobrevibacterium gyesilva TaxID=2991712 RepID=A0AA42CI06_9PROT|nr:3-hydroxybutyryl-CoA dehydrogenase [Limobrevibacterium gyesilva]